MPQFQSIPERQRILERIPDYAVSISEASGRVLVTCHGETIAESDHALLVEESRHQPVYYLPRCDVSMDLFQATDLSTYCPFKGHASYWSLKLGDSTEENLVWSYADPYPEVAGLKDYMSFYTDRADVQAG